MPYKKAGTIHIHNKSNTGKKNNNWKFSMQENPVPGEKNNSPWDTLQYLNYCGDKILQLFSKIIKTTL